MASSEQELDDNLEAEASEEETPYNCRGLQHLFDVTELRDYHYRPEETEYKFWPCNTTVCANRWSGPYIRDTGWGIPVDHWQEDNSYSVFASLSFFEGSKPEPQHLASIPEYGSPSIPGSRAQSPSPIVSPVHLSPSFAPTTLPSDLSNLFEEDDVEELLAPSQEEAEESLSSDLAFVLESLPPPSVSEEVSDFFEFHILTANMSDMKADSIPVLKKSSDYKVWSSQMLGYLTFIEADDALQAGDLTKADYKKANARAKGVILMRTDNSFHHLLYEKSEDGDEVMKSAKDMWAALKSHFGTPDAAYVWSQFSALIKSREMDDNKPMQDQISKIQTVLKDIVNGGIKLDEPTQALLLMSKIPESYSTMVSAIMATTVLKELKVETLVSKILSEESLRRSGMGQSASKTSQVKVHHGQGPCSHCGKKHGSDQCWTKYPHLRPQKATDKGKGKGKGGNGKGNGKKANTVVVHTTTDGTKVTQSGSSSSNGQGASVVEVEEVKYTACTDPSCRVCPPRTAGSLVASSLVVHNGASADAGSAQLSSSFYCPGVNKTHSHQFKRIAWLMDSGASQTVVNSMEYFWDYKPYTVPVVFGTAGNAKIEALGSGTIKGLTTVGKERMMITISNVAYIPQASGCLFSTGIVEKSGHTLVQGSGQMVIYDQPFMHGKVSGNVVMEAPYNFLNNLYFSFMDVLDRKMAALLSTPFRTWHRRMGHPSKEVIRRLPDHTKGVDPVGVEDQSPCEGCQWGKSHRAPFPASSKRATKPLELVHTDEDGPMRTQAINSGYRYFITFLDDFSSLGRAYYLRHKSESIQAFEDFKAWAENVTGNKIIHVRSDRGGEYTSDAFTARLKSYGIVHQKTVAHSPQQNGRAERWNRTIMEKAMAMLHHAGLSHGFWQLAVESAVHIYNRQPMRRLKWQCPITLWDGTVPDISYFRVFGCKAFVHVPKERRQGKLDKKAIEMIFVGYEQGSKGYKFWDASSRRIVVSRDVTFDEDSFPARKDLANPKTLGPPLFDPVDSDSEDDDEEQIEIPLPLPVESEDVYEDIDEPEPVGEPERELPEPAERPQPVQPPQPVYTRPRRENAGRNPNRNRDNVYGDEPPARIDRRTDTHGDQRAEAFMILQALKEANYSESVPTSRSDARKSPEWDHWHAAEGSEMKSHEQNGTWILVPRPKNRKIVKNRWVYARKHDGRYKARLVAKGFTQVWGEDYHETFSPVARFESLRYMFAHAALEDWEMDSMDVKTAFLNGELEEEIYMEQPEGWVVPGKEDWVCLLKKAIYGLKQASRQWNAKIHRTLLNQGFIRTYSDAGVYVYSSKTNGQVCYVVLYVDDLLLLGDSKPFIEQIKNHLKKEYQMTDLGPVEHFLGLRIRRDRQK